MLKVLLSVIHLFSGRVLSTSPRHWAVCQAVSERRPLPCLQGPDTYAACASHLYGAATLSARTSDWTDTGSHSAAD